MSVTNIEPQNRKTLTVSLHDVFAPTKKNGKDFEGLLHKANNDKRVDKPSSLKRDPKRSDSLKSKPSFERDNKADHKLEDNNNIGLLDNSSSIQSLEHQSGASQENLENTDVTIPDEVSQNDDSDIVLEEFQDIDDATIAIASEAENEIEENTLAALPFVTVNTEEATQETVEDGQEATPEAETKSPSQSKKPRSKQCHHRHNKFADRRS